MSEFANLVYVILTENLTIFRSWNAFTVASKQLYPSCIGRGKLSTVAVAEIEMGIAAMMLSIGSE